MGVVSRDMQNNTPEGTARAVIDGCADCDICRYLMEDTSCLMFPELYRLYDKAGEEKGGISPQELRRLVDLCNFCALCPCPDVRSNLMKAKHAFVHREGLKPTIRLLEDVARVARICGAFPRLAKLAFQSELMGGLLKNLAGIHPKSKVPRFPKQTFPAWARKRGLDILRSGSKRKVALFAGCTGQYLFPEVPKAVVEVLQRNGIELYYPEQRCCGMPCLLEGDQALTFEFAAFNLERLSEAVDEGCDIVCSCPTCGFMLKDVVSEGALYSNEYRASRGTEGAGPDRQKAFSRRVGKEAALPSRVLLSGLFKDEGYFASLDARKRMKIATHTYDLGEYLRDLHLAGKLNTNLGSVPSRMVYYPPCHLREQGVGEPYAELLRLVPGISLEKIDGAFYCCGMAGIMGFKRDFHEVSVAMGSRLMEKIGTLHPERLVSDCLSCRIQFNQLLPYKVLHPIEILREAYMNHGI
jgi:glycerol-3-phosphate dehydrogenase subunit C